MDPELIDNAADTPDTPAPAGEPAPEAGSAASAFLDSISDTPETPAAPATDAEKDAPPATPAAPALVAPTESPEDLDAEELEALAAVKSDRGRERIQKTFQERRQLREDVQNFKAIVQGTGMSAEEFAETLEIARLMRSGDEKGLKTALAAIETHRAAIAKRLGIEVDGVDLLHDQPDLKAAVDGLEMTRERALELAKYRRQVGEQQAVQQAAQQESQQSAEYQQLAQQGAKAMETYLATRANEADHPAKLAAIETYFKDAKNFEAFVDTYEPKQWAGVIKMMYDTMAVPRAAAPVAPSQQPLRSRASNLGSPRDASLSPMDRLAQRMDSLGI